MSENEPIFSTLSGKPCGYVYLICSQVDSVNTRWNPSGYDMNGCSGCNAYTSDPGPSTGQYTTTPCTLGDTYTYNYYCYN